MKTFDEICKAVANMRWSIIDPDTKDFDEVEAYTRQAVQQAHSAIWASNDWDFKRVKEVIDVPVGTEYIHAPAGEIVNIKVSDGREYLALVSNPDFLEAKSGTPTKYWVENTPEGNRLFLYPTPDSEIQLQVRYSTLKKACAADGTPKDNLELTDDYININPEWEELYLNALKNKAMVYLIVDNTDENWLPYKEQFEEQLQIALSALRGTKARTFIRV